MKRTGFDTMSSFAYPFYTILHPKDGFQEMKFNKKDSLVVNFVIVAAWLFVEVFYRVAMDFDMNPFVYTDVSLLRVAVITVMVYGMLCVSNWCFCTLLDGKGKLKEIFMVTAYALVPYIIVRFVTVLLSMVMLNDEQILLNYCVLLAQLWGFVMAFTGLSEIHEYGFKKTLLSLVLTAIGVIIMLFISLMLIMLFQQVYKFVTTVAIELAY